MPTYQYACTNPEGKHEFEVVQSFSDAAVAECPECGAAVRKVYGSVGVVFKGSGFYRTDSRKSGATSESSGGSASTGSSDGASSGSGSSSDGSSSGDKSSSGAKSSPGGSSSPSSSTAGSGAKAAN